MSKTNRPKVMNGPQKTSQRQGGSILTTELQLAGDGGGGRGGEVDGSVARGEILEGGGGARDARETTKLDKGKGVKNKPPFSISGFFFVKQKN